MNGLSWQITQTGNTFTGTMQFQGDQRAAMSVSGTILGTAGTFTLTIPMGAMMGAMMDGCTATATGTFNMDDLMDQIHGAYAGSNTCSGPFDRGQVSLTHR